jgi:quinol monooxygenase YgiN
MKMNRTRLTTSGMPWILWGDGDPSRARPYSGSRQTLHFTSLSRGAEHASELEQAMLNRHTMVRLTVALSAASMRAADDLLEAFHFLVVGTRLERGCLGCSTWIDPDSTVHYVEEWATEEDMRARVRSQRFTSLLAIVESAKEANVHFDFVTKTRGLEYVAEVRNETV